MWEKAFGGPWGENWKEHHLSWNPQMQLCGGVDPSCEHNSFPTRCSQGSCQCNVLGRPWVGEGIIVTLPCSRHGRQDREMEKISFPQEGVLKWCESLLIWTTRMAGAWFFLLKSQRSQVALCVSSNQAVCVGLKNSEFSLETLHISRRRNQKSSRELL